ncbi:MAG: hypothetical protein NZ918_03270 [Aigarchaeota archaeon]|nr:hypothetical protein [Aigarchaeota archaeon]
MNDFREDEKPNLGEYFKEKIGEIVDVDLKNKRLPRPLDDVIEEFVKELDEWLISKYKPTNIVRTIKEIIFDSKTYNQASLKELIQERIASPFINNFSNLFFEVIDNVSKFLWEMRGYLSIISATKFFVLLSRIDSDKVTADVKDFKIDNKSIYVIFSEMVKHEVSFDIFNTYWFMILPEISGIETEKLMKDEDFIRPLIKMYDVYRKDNELEMNELISQLTEKMCGSISKLRGKGLLLRELLHDFINECCRFIEKKNSTSVMLHDLFRFLILEHGVLEYILFRFFVEFGSVCLPRVVLRFKGGDGEEESSYESEVDLLSFRINYSEDEHRILNVYPKLVFEITTRGEKRYDDLRKIENKLKITSDLLRRSFPGSEALLVGFINVRPEGMRIFFIPPETPFIHFNL